MLLSNILLTFGLLATSAQAVIYLVETKNQGASGRECVNQINTYHIVVSNGPTMAPKNGQSCDGNLGGIVIARNTGLSGKIGSCSSQGDYVDNNGSKWMFCPDSAGGGRLENLGISPHYRQCFAERPNYSISTCINTIFPTMCHNKSTITVWCHDALIHW